MRTYSQIAETARGGPAFSNSSQFEMWSANRGCGTCRNDDDATEKWCPILSVALAEGRTPAEWLTFSENDEIHGNYTCTEYDRRDDDGPDDREPTPEPGPPPVMDGQVDMFEVFADQISAVASTNQPAEATR